VILLLERLFYTPRSTIGQWYVDGIYQCDSLEDPVREDPVPATAPNEAKVYGETAIPAGRYRVVLQKPHRAIWSPRADGHLLHLLDVPGFDGVYVHAFNSPGETLGCLGTGTRDPGRPDWVGGSRTSLERLMRKIEEGFRAGDVWLTIEDRREPLVA